MNFSDQSTFYSPSQCSDVSLVAADWVVPVSRPPIKDGALALRDNLIWDIGPARTLKKKYSVAEFIDMPGILMPGLVNAHTHLELSHLKTPAPLQTGETFVDWIKNLLQRRAENPIPPETAVLAIKTELTRQFAEGVSFIADTGNEWHEGILGEEFEGRRLYRMLEVLAPNRIAEEHAFKRISALDNDVVVTCHAPYSTVPSLLQSVKQRCDKLGHVFSIHTAESSSEYDFISTKSGIFREFLEERDSWDGAFTEIGKNDHGTVSYFYRLGLLNNKTLLVHCVNVSDAEIDLIVNSNTNVCLCPSSNRFLAVGDAPVYKMVRKGILPAIGTDSHASNDSPSMWREMQVLFQSNIEMSAGVILTMATLGGAKAFGLEKQYGSFEPGRKAQILNIQDTRLQNIARGDFVERELVSGGLPEKISWVRIPQKFSKIEE